MTFHLAKARKTFAFAFVSVFCFSQSFSSLFRARNGAVCFNRSARLIKQRLDHRKGFRPHSNCRCRLGSVGCLYCKSLSVLICLRFHLLNYNWFCCWKAFSLANYWNSNNLSIFVFSCILFSSFPFFHTRTCTQALAWFSDLLVEHYEIFWSLFAVDMELILAEQPPDTWESFSLFQVLNNYLLVDGQFDVLFLWPFSISDFIKQIFHPFSSAVIFHDRKMLGKTNRFFCFFNLLRKFVRRSFSLFGTRFVRPASDSLCRLDGIQHWSVVASSFWKRKMGCRFTQRAHYQQQWRCRFFYVQRKWCHFSRSR